MGWASAVMELAGDLFGANRAEKAEDQSFRQNKKAIQTRVKDAERAGVHPLFALNASVPTYSPAAFIGGGQHLAQGLSDMGQNIDRAVSAQETPEQRELRLKQLQLLDSQIGETDARKEMYSSEAARNRQQIGQSSGLPGGGSFLSLTSDPSTWDKMKFKPDEVLSHQSGSPHVGAGTHPTFREYTLDKRGTQILLPYSEEGPGEALENIPTVLYPYIIAVNRDQYGPNWGSAHLRRFFGDTEEDIKAFRDFYEGRPTGRPYYLP